MSPSSTIANSVLQVFIFAFVPFVFYLVSRRSAKGFLGWIGLYSPTRRPMFWATLFIVVTAPLPVLLYLVPEFREISLARGTTGGDFSAMDPSVTTAAVILIWAFLRTGLAEELLFRGFVGKRLIALLGFGWGNMLQAAVFSSPHLLVFAVPGGSSISLPGVALLFLVAFSTGWIFGFLNERVGNGSIAPSCWCHGAGNVVAYFAAVLS